MAMTPDERKSDEIDLESLDDELLSIVLSDWLMSKPKRARRVIAAMQGQRAKLSAAHEKIASMREEIIEEAAKLFEPWSENHIVADWDAARAIRALKC